MSCCNCTYYVNINENNETRKFFRVENDWFAAEGMQGYSKYKLLLVINSVVGKSGNFLLCKYTKPVFVSFYHLILCACRVNNKMRKMRKET